MTYALTSKDVLELAKQATAAGDDNEAADLAQQAGELALEERIAERY